jgi:hypothetical protein
MSHSVTTLKLSQHLVTHLSFDNMSFKRSRTPSQSSSGSSSSSPSHISKATRTNSATKHGTTGHPLLCTLPPTCNPPHNHSTPIANSKDLELHYAKYHAHVCEDSRCGCVFPDARLLELVRRSSFIFASYKDSFWILHLSN